MVHRRAPVAHNAIGDRAVDGLLGGFVAGTIILGYLAAMGLLNTLRLSDLLGLFAMDGAGFVEGALLHLAVAGVYGVILGVMWPYVAPGDSTGAGLLIGLLYGVFLWLFARFLLLPGDAPLLRLPAAHFLISHLLYGLSLGWFFARAEG